MPCTQEQVIQVASELDRLTQICISQKYVSHCTIQQQYNILVARCEPLGDAISSEASQSYISSRRKLDDALQTLEANNKEKMLIIDFKRTCMSLIRLNDLDNLKGLVDIAEYFGVGQGKTTMCVVDALYEVYNTFKLNKNLRIPDARLCVDFICDLLKEDKLNFQPISWTTTYEGALFRQIDLTKTLQTIFDYDDINKLMVWMVSATVGDIEFALRLAASSKTSAPSNCFMFLLLQTRTDGTCTKPISLLSVAADKPNSPSTKQTAMHRVVRAGNTQTALMILSHEFNPSDDLLKQLIARDRNNQRPIDYIEMIEDVVSQILMIERIKTAINTYRTEERYGLSGDVCDSIITELDTLDVGIKSKFSIFN